MQVTRIVPPSTTRAWIGGLLALPAVWFVLDPFTDAARVFLHTVPGADTLMQIARPFGKFETQVLMGVAVWLVARACRWRHLRSWLLVTAIAVLVSGAITYVMKVVVHRDRPAITSAAIDATGLGTITTGKSMSFPSGDTAAAFAIACVLAAYAPGLRVPATVVAWLVGLSRVYFGCHFFSDVLAGALVGSLVAGLVLARTRRKRVVIVTECCETGLEADN